MTSFDRRVTRVTLGAYRMTVSGAVASPSGRRIVATLRGDQTGDWLELREAGRKYRVVLDVAALYFRGMKAQALALKAEKRKARRRS